MPAKQVLKYECERCTRTWYVDADKVVTGTVKEVLSLAAEFVQGEPIKLTYECLCGGCRKTVKNLVDAICKDLNKAAPVRGAKKKGGVAAAEPAGKGDAPPPTDSAAPSATPQPAAPTNGSSSPPARASVATSSEAGRPASSSSVRPTQR